jgi:Ca2+-transporting ATPase
MNDVASPFEPTGLSQAQAAALLTRHGPNELPRSRRRSLVGIAIDVLREPMLLLLLAGGVAYLLLGDWMEASVLLLFATFSVVITIVQQTRTEKVLDALRDLSAPRALVIRDGQRVRIAGREVVEGDVLVLVQGDRVAADAMLLQAGDLQADESLLTGESVPVTKRAEAPAATTPAAGHRPGGDGQPHVYAGSLIVRGSGVAVVSATGPRSEIGRIGASLVTLEPEAPRLRAETGRLILFCGIGAAGVTLAVVLLYGLLRGGWLEAVLAGIAVGMAMLPEEFPVVLTVFLAMGAWRIGLAGVLTRRADAIETLGSATVLCTDKTGTLTENRMRVVALWRPGAAALTLTDSALPDHFHDVIDLGVRAGDAVPVDPMEIAIHALRRPQPAAPGQQPRHGYGLRPDLLAIANIWAQPGSDDEFSVAAKGAPEAILELCHATATDRAAILAAVDGMAARGIRVLGIAEARTRGTDWPETARGFDFEFVGLIGLADPIRASVPAAVAQCRSAGIKVVMITGDHAVTAAAIAGQAGIARGDVLTGEALAGMDDATLARHLATVTVFARIMPEQKLRIVSAYKAAGEIVAMTGDGVNDAPSLKAANIGVAMGKRGTDVAREASAMVLLDDDFGAIVLAVALGRRIYDNIRKAMAFIFAVHVPIAGLAVLPLALGMPLLLTPIHIALLEMIIDPVCALVFEAENPEDDIMRRRPRDRDERLFSWRLIARSVAQGGLGFALLAGLALGTTRAGWSEGEVRATTFLALVGIVLMLVLVNRSFGASPAQALTRPNAILRHIVIAILGVCIIIFSVPAIRSILHFDAIRLIDLALVAGLGGLALALLEGLKLLAPQRDGNGLAPPVPVTAQAQPPEHSAQNVGQLEIYQEPPPPAA